MGLFEFIRATDDMRDAITRRVSRAELRRTAETPEYSSIASDGWRKVSAGTTTLEEVLRVVSL